MAQTSTWSVQDTQSIHTIVYRGNTREGNARMTIDGIAQEFVPMIVPGYGRIVRQIVGTKDMILLMPSEGMADLLVDGTCLNSGKTVDTAQLLARAMEMPPAHAKLNARIKNGRSTLLSMSTLTLLSILLTLLGTDWYFPFSAFIPRQLCVIGHAQSIAGGGVAPLIVYGGAALAVVGFFVVLWALSARFTTPILVALVTFLADSVFYGLVLVAVLRQSPGDVALYAVDALFHIWVLASLVSLLLARIKANAARRTELAAPFYSLPPATGSPSFEPIRPVTDAPSETA